MCIDTTKTTNQSFFKKENVVNPCRQGDEAFTLISEDAAAKIAGRITLPRVEFKKLLKVGRSPLEYLSQDDSVLKIIQDCLGLTYGIIF